ncbi:MAG: hypothetical protein ABL857_08390 [Rickettsiales bacterium]
MEDTKQGYSELKEQCVKSRDSLIGELKKSRFGAELEPKIDEFSVQTRNYLKTADQYHKRIESVCGSMLVDNEGVEFLLKHFKDSMNVAMQTINPLIATKSPDIDQNNHSRTKEKIEKKLQNAMIDLDRVSADLFKYTESIAKINPMGLRTGYYLN